MKGIQCTIPTVEQQADISLMRNDHIHYPSLMASYRDGCILRFCTSDSPFLILISDIANLVLQVPVCETRNIKS